MARRQMRWDMQPEDAPAALGAIEDRSAEWTGMEVEGFPARILIRLGNDRGRLICTGLILGAFDDATEITTRSLRELPIAEMLAYIGAKLPDDDAIDRFLADYTLDRAPLFRGTKARRGPRRLEPEYFERVADEYREARIRSPRRPMSELADRLEVSVATARRHVGKAREMGLFDDLGGSQ